LSACSGLNGGSDSSRSAIAFAVSPGSWCATPWTPITATRRGEFPAPAGVPVVCCFDSSISDALCSRETQTLDGSQSFRDVLCDFLANLNKSEANGDIAAPSIYIQIPSITELQLVVEERADGTRPDLHIGPSGVNELVGS